MANQPQLLAAGWGDVAEGEAPSDLRRLMAGLLAADGPARLEGLEPWSGGSAADEPARDGRATDGRKAESDRVC